MNSEQMVSFRKQKYIFNSVVDDCEYNSWHIGYVYLRLKFKQFNFRRGVQRKFFDNLKWVGRDQKKCLHALIGWNDVSDYNILIWVRVFRYTTLQKYPFRMRTSTISKNVNLLFLAMIPLGVNQIEIVCSFFPLRS